MIVWLPVYITVLKINYDDDKLDKNVVTRSQAAARIADRTASQQTLVISNRGLMAYCTAHETPCSHLDMFPVTLSHHYSR